MSDDYTNERLRDLLAGARSQCQHAQKERDELQRMLDAQGRLNAGMSLNNETLSRAYSELEEEASNLRSDVARLRTDYRRAREGWCNALEELDSVKGKDQIRDVADFARQFGQRIGCYASESVGTVGYEKSFRQALEYEEWRELCDAIYTGSQTEAADARIDLAWVLLGTNICYYGEEATREMWDEVDRSNRAKVVNPNGKPTKPDGWVGPKIKEIIDRVIRRSE